MFICRFEPNRVGIVVGEDVVDVTDCLDVLPEQRYPLPTFDPMIAALSQLRPAFAAAAATGPKIPLSQVKLLSPVANPGKIVAAPVNYVEHLKEAREDEQISFKAPVLDIHKVGLFLKATSSIVGPAAGVALRHNDRRNDHEIELVAVIGSVADRVSVDDALNYVAGYAVGLDMTVRGQEERSFRKSIDTYSVVGPWMVTADEISNPDHLELSVTVNGEMRQSDNTKNLIMSVSQLISLASSFYTLHPGDLLFTGTPVGVASVVPGDVMTARVEQIGEMQVDVRSA